MTATEHIRPGQLLLVTPPIAIVKGDLGEIPDHDDLSDMLTDVYDEAMVSRPRFTAWQAQWLKALARTIDPSSSSSSSTSSSSTAEVPDLLAPIDSRLRYPHSNISQHSGSSDGAAAAASAGADTSSDSATEDTTAAAAAAAAAGSDDCVGFWDLGMSEEDLWNAIGARNRHADNLNILKIYLCALLSFCRCHGHITHLQKHRMAMHNNKKTLLTVYLVLINDATNSNIQ